MLLSSVESAQVIIYLKLSIIDRRCVTDNNHSLPICLRV